VLHIRIKLHRYLIRIRYAIPHATITAATILWAVLRTVIGITQKEMAEILECSTATVQAIELGKLKMSMKLAGNLFHQTSINLDWLMNDDVSKPPVDYEDNPYTRESFEVTQAALFAPPQDSSDVRRALFYAPRPVSATGWNSSPFSLPTPTEKHASRCATTRSPTPWTS